jgi:hypothetical protein
VLLTLVAHAVEGSIQSTGLIYLAAWAAVAIGLVAFDRRFWRGPSPEAATTSTGPA